jgi:hypothetical protein
MSEKNEENESILKEEFQASKVITLANQKGGGTGKTQFCKEYFLLSCGGLWRKAASFSNGNSPAYPGG